MKTFGSRSIPKNHKPPYSHVGCELRRTAAATRVNAMWLARSNTFPEDCAGIQGGVIFSVLPDVNGQRHGMSLGSKYQVWAPELKAGGTSKRK